MDQLLSLEREIERDAACVSQQKMEIRALEIALEALIAAKVAEKEE